MISKRAVIHAVAIIYGCDCAIAQSNETTSLSESAYFQDVTATHVPADPEAHILDAGLADVDKDGDLDVLLALEGAPNRLYLNDGNGLLTWEKGVFTQASHDMEHVRVADFDKDGILDCIFVAEDDQHHEYYLGNGDGSFRDLTERLPAVSEGNGLDVGDVNSDGLPDIIVGNSGSQGQNFLWINDADGDGDRDIVFANLTSNGGKRDKDPRARLLLNNGEARFSDMTESKLPKNDFSTYAAAPFDIDRDGHPDLLLSAMKIPPFEAMQVQAWRNDGKGNFTDITSKAIPGNTTGRSWGIVTGDLNGDGLTDVFIGGWGTQARLLLAK